MMKMMINDEDSCDGDDNDGDDNDDRYDDAESYW